MSTSPTRTARSSFPLIAALLASALGAFSAIADAAPPAARRLTLTIDGLREGALQHGADRGRERLTQQFTLSVLLHTDGAPMSGNPLDPQDAQRQLERAQRAQQRVQAGLDRAGVRAAPAPDMQALQARAQQIQARCGTDRDCLMREAMALSAAQTAGGDRATQGRRQAGGGAPDDSDRDEEVETPYLHFIGRAACQLDIAIRIDGRTEGSFQDVQGTVPFTQTVQADARQRDDMRCPLVQAVLDTRNGRLWAHTAMVMPEVPGQSVRSEKGRSPQRHDGPVSLQWREANDWLQQRLQNLGAAGEDKARVPVSGGQNELRLRWRFAPI